VYSVWGLSDIARGVTILAVLASCKFPELSDLGSHDGSVADTATDGRPPMLDDLTSFAFLTANNASLTADVHATINGTNIVAPIEPTTDTSALVAQFTTTGTDVFVNGVSQQTGVTTNDFTHAVRYLVTGADGSSKAYVVTATYPSLTPDFELATGAGTQPRSVATADFNGDGKPDIVVADQSNSNVSVFLDTTTGNQPSFGARLDVDAGTTAFAVAVGDFNGDGRPDLAVAGASMVAVLLNTTSAGATTASFAPKVLFATGANPFGVAVGDFNGDGKVDLAIADLGADRVSILLNTTAMHASTPTFSARVDFVTPTHPSAVGVGDFNGDGIPDVAVTSDNSNVVAILLNTTATNASTPTFAAMAPFTTGVTVESVAIADINGDGKADVVVADDSSMAISVLLNTTPTNGTTPSFAAEVRFPTGANPLSVALADLNGDGEPDAIVANLTAQPPTISVLLNSTPAGGQTAMFAPKVDFVTGANPICVATADLDGDGKPDIVVADQGAAAASVLLDLTPFP
jgi:hypothetical protein